MTRAARRARALAAAGAVAAPVGAIAGVVATAEPAEASTAIYELQCEANGHTAQAKLIINWDTNTLLSHSYRTYKHSGNVRIQGWTWIRDEWNFVAGVAANQGFYDRPSTEDWTIWPVNEVRIGHYKAGGEVFKSQRFDFQFSDGSSCAVIWMPCDPGGAAPNQIPGPCYRIY